MSFLTAEWRKLAIANYKVNPNILKPYLPFGTELDLWEDTCYVSLIGFMFQKVRLLGLKIPYHVNFAEVNLRFYVKRKANNSWRRGVVFIKEIVPLPALALVANLLYNEKYETKPMLHSWTDNNNTWEIDYRWKQKSNWQQIKVIADKEAIAIVAGSEAEFITEHYYGYAKVNNAKSNQYEVTHPKWEQYAVKDYAITVDFALNYGREFQFLNNIAPASVMLAEGSPITIESKSTIAKI
ncbi:YqjF family protein [Adhaeribacter pallidiroseus]|uniref:DUF2071 domain-containing protein n=1 Tax=Adhaeribacter pallidiroseus TaxID=2072847 RepID=A0A369QFS6_9BACT|nr:DUF2071 domain-containing protein [Adhaeribacter pallidiroseus]RDC62405.1 hypothetical protein AHMF7616_00999 [Adhaeribacter pallidiroseus]